MKRLIQLLCICVLVVRVAAQSTENSGGEKYLGQTPPGATPVMFAPGIVSTNAHEYSFTVRKDGKEIFFTRHENNYSFIYWVRVENGKWLQSEVTPFSGRWSDYDQMLSPDGNTLYFVSDRPRLKTPYIGDIYFVQRTKNGWSDAKSVGAPVNTEGNEACPSITSEGTLYWHGVYPQGKGRSDIYFSRQTINGFSIPVNCGPGVNTEFGESNAFVDPEERYIIFGSRRPGGLGGGDLYISIKRKDGSWGGAIHLKSPVNSPASEYCPSVSVDGKYLFFTRRGQEGGDIFWADASFIQDLVSSHSN